ncbi:MAG: RNA-binding domain-containing protein, partial [Candidatus Helarchaeota archaeon]
MKTPIYPTEDGDKVRKCILNLVSEANIEIEGDYLVARSAETHLLYPIQNKLRQQRIRDSARKILRRSMMPNFLEFHLSKQAAFVGRVHFVTNPEKEDHLGPITVRIEAEEE